MRVAQAGVLDCMRPFRKMFDAKGSVLFAVLEQRRTSARVANQAT